MTSPSQPGEQRRLERPPGERYAPSPTPAGGSPPRGPGSAIAVSQGIAIAGAAATVFLGNVLEVDLGLVALAALVGWLIGSTLRPAAGRSGRRKRLVAAGTAAESVLLGQAGLWLLARAQGGVLDPLAYLGQLFGIAVPLQLVAGVAAAWWAAR